MPHNQSLKFVPAYGLYCTKRGQIYLFDTGPEPVLF